MSSETADVVDATAARLTGVVPIVPVRRVARTIDFYTKVLGFTLADRNIEGTFAYLTRDGAGVMLLDLKDVKALQATSSYLSSYIWVDGVEAYYASIRPMLDRLPEGRLQPLFHKPDGRAEFHVRDPDGFLLFFGEALGA
ncbi:MAG: VOC family protein [Pseudomonadota bacterium]